MNSVLYLVPYGPERFYLHGVQPGQSGSAGDAVYFRNHHDTLFTESPTFFNTAQEAVYAAELAGFTVAGTWNHRDGHKHGLEPLRELGVNV